MTESKRATEIKRAMEIKIKYFDPQMPKLKRKADKSDWIDLRAAETVNLKKGEFCLIRLGVAMKLPEGYEAYVIPRSSTFSKYKIIQTNSFGLIDNSYCGNNDEWKFPVIAMEDTVIEKYDRICQFRVEKRMPDFSFEEVSELSEENRGGFGATGIR